MEESQKTKKVNAGEFIKEVLEIAENKGFTNRDLDETETDEVLFSLGLPASNWDIKISY